MTTAIAPPTFLFRGGERPKVCHVISALCIRLAEWLERDHFYSDVTAAEQRSLSELASLLRAAAAKALELVT
jgi:hypothetical protein